MNHTYDVVAILFKSGTVAYILDDEDILAIHQQTISHIKRIVRTYYNKGCLYDSLFNRHKLAIISRLFCNAACL